MRSAVMAGGVRARYYNRRFCGKDIRGSLVVNLEYRELSSAAS